MPWLVRKQEGQFCVFKEGADGQPVGGSLGCHPNEEEANGQRRALYANAEKALPGFTLWKEAHTGLYRWIAYYSNNYRDDDSPSEIISKESHERFVEMVDKGIVDYPELWLWHVPVAWGKADWLAFSDGFALASGTVYPAYNRVAESLMKEKNLATSHGMPRPLLVYDEQDKSVIRFHVTKEISPLPLHRAANKRTGFVILRGDEGMPLDAEKKDWLINKARLKPDFVEALEKQMDDQAADAKAQGIESKEASAPVTEPVLAATATAAPEASTPVTPATVPATPVVAEPVVVAQVKEANYVTREEVAAVLTELLTPFMQNQTTFVENQTKLVAQVTDLTKEITSLKATDASKLALLKEATPPASLRDLINRNLFGGATEVKEGDPLSGDKPKEAAPAASQYAPTVVPFLNGLLSTAGAGK